MAIPLISANKRRLAVSLSSWLTIVISRLIHSFAPIRLPLECRLCALASLRDAAPFPLSRIAQSRPVKVDKNNPRMIRNLQKGSLPCRPTPVLSRLGVLAPLRETPAFAPSRLCVMLPRFRFPAFRLPLSRIAQSNPVKASQA
jgi:hypothetical protein